MAKTIRNEALLRKLNKELKKSELCWVKSSEGYSLYNKDLQEKKVFNVMNFLTEDGLYSILYTLALVLAQEGLISRRVYLEEVLGKDYNKDILKVWGFSPGLFS